jgi:hypothetical protein
VVGGFASSYGNPQPDSERRIEMAGTMKQAVMVGDIVAVALFS